MRGLGRVDTGISRLRSPNPPLCEPLSERVTAANLRRARLGWFCHEHCDRHAFATGGISPYRAGLVSLRRTSLASGWLAGGECVLYGADGDVFESCFVGFQEGFVGDLYDPPDRD